MRADFPAQMCGMQVQIFQRPAIVLRTRQDNIILHGPSWVMVAIDDGVFKGAVMGMDLADVKTPTFRDENVCTSGPGKAALCFSLIIGIR